MCSSPWINTIIVAQLCVLGLLRVDTTRSNQDLWWEWAGGEFWVSLMCWSVRIKITVIHVYRPCHSCWCAALATWTSTTGKRIRSTRMATPATTQSSSGFGRWDNFPRQELISPSCGPSLGQTCPYVYRRCCWWMRKSEFGCCSLWREHPGSRWTASLNSTVTLSFPAAMLLLRRGRVWSCPMDSLSASHLVPSFPPCSCLHFALWSISHFNLFSRF